MYWHEKIKRLVISPSNQEGVKKKRYEVKEDVASLILMYLSLGEDYAYNMAKEFAKHLKKENGWKIEQLKLLRSLKDQSQLQPILKIMEEERFLISSLRKVEGRNRRYFRLNPAIVSTPYDNYNSDFPGENKYTSEVYGQIEISQVEINQLLEKLGENGRKSYLQKWSEIPRLDFSAFLHVFIDEATKLENHKVAVSLDDYLLETSKVVPLGKKRDHLANKERNLEREKRFLETEFNALRGVDNEEEDSGGVNFLPVFPRIVCKLVPIGTKSDKKD